MVSERLNKEKYEEQKEFFDRLKSLKSTYGTINKSNLVGFGFFSEGFNFTYNDIELEKVINQNINYIVNPLRTLIAKDAQNFQNKITPVDIFVYMNTLNIEHSHTEEKEY